MKNPEIVADQGRLEALCRDWRTGGAFAFDTEFIRDETYDAILCLIQVTDGDTVVLVDPVADIDVTPFWDLVTDPKLVSIVHAGKEDFEVCLRATGTPPRNIFDVQIAAGFVGYGYPLSLSRLVTVSLHKRIAKGQTLTDWLRRPLTRDQIRYAAEDVLYLPAVYEKLSAELERHERSAWAREEFSRFESADFYQPPAQDRLFKLKGSKQLDALGLAALERLIVWRDEWARAKNRPTRALMRDDVLVDIAKRRPTRPEQLEVLRGFPQARNRKVVNELLTVIREAHAVPQDKRPEPHRPREDSPMDKAVLDILSAFVRAVCHEENVDNDLVGSKQALRDLMEHVSDGGADTRPRLLTGWRERFIGRRLVDLLKGRCELHLSGWPDGTRLEVVSARPARRRARPDEPRPRKSSRT